LEFIFEVETLPPTEEWEELGEFYASGKLIGPSYFEESEEEVEVEGQEQGGREAGAASDESESVEAAASVNPGGEIKDMEATSTGHQKSRQTKTKKKQNRFSNAVVHLDRSSLALLSVGMAEVWAQWFALGYFVDALVLSASGFGATAGEIGRQTHTWFGKGCVRADLSAT